MDYSIYDYNSDEKLLQEQEIEEINNVKMSLLNTLITKLNNAGIYFNSTSRIKSESSLLHKLETGKYSMQDGGRKIQDIIGIRINLFYLEDMDICEKILEETFLLDNWSNLKLRSVTVCSGYRANICATYLQVCGTSHLTRHLRFSSGRCSSRVGMR